jgi:hypothetical protein
VCVGGSLFGDLLVAGYDVKNMYTELLHSTTLGGSRVSETVPGRGGRQVQTNA